MEGREGRTVQILAEGANLPEGVNILIAGGAKG